MELVPPNERGTYAGVAHPATISHLKKLGITAIDSIFYNLPFERFLSAMREEEPDIDVDTAADQRRQSPAVRYMGPVSGRMEFLPDAQVSTHRDQHDSAEGRRVLQPW